MSTIQTEVQGLLPLKKQFQLLKMPIKQRRRILFRIGKQVAKDARQRVRQQRDLHGRAFEPRKTKKRGKMLAKLVAAKQMFIRATGTEATVGFKGRGGRIAAKHQQGSAETVRASDLPRTNNARSAPATAQQAKALLAAGYTIKRANGKGQKNPTQRHIKENLSIARAGTILRFLRGSPGKRSWRIKLPKRSFLGATQAEVDAYLDTISDQVIKDVRHGTR